MATAWSSRGRSRSTTITCSPSPTASRTRARSRHALSLRAGVARTVCPPSQHYWVLHEGFVGVADGTLKDANYDDFKDKGDAAEDISIDRRLGRHHRQILDGGRHPAAERELRRHLSRRHACGGTKAYQADYRLGARTIAPGDATEVTHHLFAGAKVVTSSRTIDDTARHRAFRPGHRLGLVLLPHPAVLLAARLFSTSCSAISASPSCSSPSR